MICRTGVNDRHLKIAGRCIKRYKFDAKLLKWFNTLPAERMDGFRIGTNEGIMTNLVPETKMPAESGHLKSVSG